MSRDVVLSCFATPSPQTLNAIKAGPKGDTYFQPPERYKDPPLVLTVPFTQLPDEGSVSPAYERQALLYKKQGGSIIKGALNALAPGVDVRTVTIVTFSGGQAFAKAVIKQGEGDVVDGIVLLDGLHLTMANNGPVTDGIQAEWQPWVDFAKRAVVGEKLLVLFHTEITLPPNIRALNTTQSAAIISAQLDADKTLPSSPGPCSYQDLLDATSLGPPPPKVTIWSPIGDSTKTWEIWPTNIARVQGSYFEIGTKGNGPQDHIFAATYGQRLVWDRIMSPRLNQDGTQCLAVNSVNLVKASAPGECVKKLTTLPASLQGVADTTSSKILFTMAGMGLGYILGKYLWS